MNPPALRVRDIMLTRFESFRPDTPIADAIHAILAHKLMGAPVVADGVLLGVFAEKDAFRIPSNRLFELDMGRGGTVADFMTTKVVTVDADEGLATIVHHFLTHHHRGLPVTDDGKLVGLISRADVLRAMADIQHRRVLGQYPDYNRPYPEDRRTPPPAQRR